MKQIEGCGFGFTIEVIIIDLGNIEVDEEKLKLFPNPAGNFIEFNASGLSWSIETIKGERILNSTSTTFQQRVDISTLSSGLYILRCGTKYQLFEKK